MKRSDIKISDITGGDVGMCRELCNGLMKFQAEKSFIRTDVQEAMTFANRLKPSFENAQMKKLLVGVMISGR